MAENKINKFENMDAKIQALKPKQGKMFVEPLQQDVLPNHFNMLHGKAIDLLSGFFGKNFVTDSFTGVGIMKNRGICLKLESTDEIIVNGLRPSTLKLLVAAIGDFTARNHTGEGKKNREINYNFAIPIEQYALLCKCDIVRHEIDKTGKTKEQIKAERLKEEKRADRAYSKFKKKVLDDLKFLRLVSLNFSEKVEGREQEFDLAIISSKGKGIEARRKDGHINGYIVGTFDPNFAAYLLRLPQTTFLTSFFALDERKENLIGLAYKLQIHYFMYNNQIADTSNTLKVSTLLKYLSYPTIDKVRADNHSWEERIKEPFERLFDSLKGDIISDWSYGEENYTFTTYEEWINGKIYFELANAPDNTAQIENFQKKAAENKKKREQRKKRGQKRKEA